MRLRRRPPEDLVERIRAGTIGRGAVLDGPFGPRRMVYADVTASGQALDFVEDLIREHVLPTYGNTHTEASATGRRTTELREQARRLIHRAVGGGPDDAVAIVSLGLRHPPGMLHAGFVVAVLSDLFGIQARSGCFCAGPYMHRAHPIDDDWSARMHACAANAPRAPGAAGAPRGHAALAPGAAQPGVRAHPLVPAVRGREPCDRGPCGETGGEIPQGPRRTGFSAGDVRPRVAGGMGGDPRASGAGRS